MRGGQSKCLLLCLVSHLTEEEIDCVAMERDVDLASVEHLFNCESCIQHMERALSLIHALGEEKAGRHAAFSFGRDARHRNC